MLLRKVWPRFTRQSVMVIGAVLQKELKGADEKVVMDSDYVDDLAVMDNTEKGLQ